MSLTFLKATNFRNFFSLDLEPIPYFNLISGDNGSGKTSILEAIYYLSLARSFRCHLANRVILYNQSQFSVFGSVKNKDISCSVGIEKSKTSKIRIKIANESVVSAVELAKIIPVQLINPDSYQLLNAGPRIRRQFIDWGTFHVEQSFFAIWRRFQRALKQRNIALQKKLSFDQITAWDTELVQNANELTQLREKYVKSLYLSMTTVFSDLVEMNGLTIDFYQGWDTQQNLQNILISNFYKDLQNGYTQFGPQKADLMIKINDIPVESILSRGEQKLLVCALSLSQGYLLKQLVDKNCIYLIDDLASELDSEHRKKIIDVLIALKAQVFITTIEPHIFDKALMLQPSKMFHVKQGELIL